MTVVSIKTEGLLRQPLVFLSLTLTLTLTLTLSLTLSLTLTLTLCNRYS